MTEHITPLELHAIARTAPPAPRGPVSLGEQRATLRTGDHAALVYWRPDELLAQIVPYLAAGLAAGDKVVYVADDLPVDRIAAALAATGADVVGEQARGRLVIVTARDAFFGDGRFDVDRALAGVTALAADARAAGFTRIRLSVEMTYLLADVPGIERGPEFEGRANAEVFARHPFVCICSFNASRGVSGDVLADILATHPIVIAGGIPLVNPRYRPWGEPRELG